MTKTFYKYHERQVIPASAARRESFLKKDSGQAGMTGRRYHSNLLTDSA
jgi:hypothetical protein